jgi:hypothetical protein
MFAVKPRYWVANIRANMVDMIVGFSMVAFMAGTNELTSTIIWGAVYGFWLIVLKPRSSPLLISAQGFIAQGVGLTALLNNYNSWPQVILIAMVWVICFSSARHVLGAFEDGTNRVMSHVWGVFGAEMSLILGYWQIIHIDILPQLTLILSIIGYALGVGYYQHKSGGLRAGMRTQLVAFVVVALLVVVIVTDWQASSI